MYWTEKDLDVLTDNQLKFHSHVTAVTRKARRLLGLIGSHSFNFQTLPYLYKAIVRPILEYENIIWEPFYKGDENLIEQIQRKATRLVSVISLMKNGSGIWTYHH